MKKIKLMLLMGVVAFIIGCDGGHFPVQDESLDENSPDSSTPETTPPNTSPVVEPESPPSVEPSKPDPVIIPSACADLLSADELAASALIEFSPEAVFPGQTATLNWHVFAGDAQTQVSLAYQGKEISRKMTGAKQIPYLGDGDFTLNISRCGQTSRIAFKQKLIPWQPDNVSMIESVQPKADQAGAWAGGRDGKFYGSSNGLDWVKIAGARRARMVGMVKVLDTSSINSILDFGSDCGGQIFWGSEAGYLYRSEDEGQTIKGLSGGEFPIQYYTSQPKDPFKYPSAIRFVIRDPNNAKRFYVGHSAGLMRFDDCSDPRAEKAKYLLPHENLRDAQVFEGRLFVIAGNTLKSTAEGADWKLHPLAGTPLWLSGGDYLVAGTTQGMYVYKQTKWYPVSQNQSVSGLFLNEGIVLEALDDGVAYKVNGQEGFLPGLDQEVSQLNRSEDQKILWALTPDGDLFHLSF